MSNFDDDFDFDDDFNLDDDDEGFGGDFDDEENGGDEFAFEDEAGFDDASAFDDEGFDDFGTSIDEGFLDEDDAAGEPAREGGGTSRAFIFAAVLMLIVFGIGLVLLIAVITGERPPSDLELSATAVVMRNMTVEAQLTQTEVANQSIFMTQTAIALTPTATATATPTDTPTPTEEVVITDEATAQVDVTPTPETPPTVGIGGAQDVANTATALALTLRPQPTVTPGGGSGGQVTTPGPSVTRQPVDTLPETGLNFGEATAFLLMGVGLIGVIFFSRKARSANNRKR